jgi:hypothetical protein
MNEQEFWNILHDVPEPKPIFWRLYYQDDGTPICYSMEELPHNYIEIDAETYHRGPLNVRVVKGRIVYLDGNYREKLVPSDTGTMCHKDDISIVVNTHGQYWSKKIYITE